MARRSQRYDTALASVRETTDRHDPEGLLAMGAPADEYDAEATDLVRLVLGESPVTTSSVEHVWRRWFGDGHRLTGSILDGLTDDLISLQVRLGVDA